MIIDTIDQTNKQLMDLTKGMKEASIAQDKHSSVLVIWTIVMAVAIAVQALFEGFQIYHNITK